MFLRPLAFFALLSVASCAAPPVLYTDEFFRAAAPEVLRSWQNPGWFRATRTVELPTGAGVSALRQALSQQPQGGAVLVGMLLSQNDRRDLIAQSPHLNLWFLVSTRDEAPSTLSVRRSEAWAQVARDQAVKNGPNQTAFALFPSNATSDEIRDFEEAWHGAGGGSLTTGTGLKLPLAMPLPDQVFQWAGSEGEALALSLPPSVLVHGNPGTVRVSGTKGATWALRERDLGAFLWETIQNPASTPQFLPVETVFAGY